jgi:malto-oligosyltrehalose trehalohydrolase
MTFESGVVAARSTELARRWSFGPRIEEDGVRFRIWAPKHRQIGLAVEGHEETLPMTALADGWHETLCADARPGTRYRFELPDGLRVPDPASRHQPQDVHGPSEVVDPDAFRWSDEGWRGRPEAELVVYELHLGAFTQEGTFRAAIERLDHLAGLGVTALQLMPVADFPGSRNWGYDGTLIYAPDSAYGRPEDFKALVEAAHAKGLSVLLDVVYNHLGPDGNYLPAYAPVFDDRRPTPWGGAINYDAPQNRPLRDYVIENALFWIEEFHLDGLRFDAVHAISDESEEHLLDEMARRIRRETTGRTVHLILENEDNEASLLTRGADGRPLAFSAQWNDDVHHVLHAAATGEDFAYYADYAGDTGKLVRALAEGFAFQGEKMPYRGAPRGEPSAGLPPTAFIAFIQNHDQIGNRAFGERITTLAPPAAVKAAAAIYLLGPQVPMLFMGEEWGAKEPFPFFCDFPGELAHKVREGRREEFARFPQFRDPATRDRIPDPCAAETFRSAKLDWMGPEHEPGRKWLAWYRRILAVRRQEVVPLAGRITSGGEATIHGERCFEIVWAGRLRLAANLGATACKAGETAGRMIWLEGSRDGEILAPWSVEWSIPSQEDSSEGP